MKNTLIILSILLTIGVFAYEDIHLQRRVPLNTRIYNYDIPYNYNYMSPYRYRTINYNDEKKLRRMRILRGLERLRRNYYYYNYLTWNKPGQLTGYSVPINSNDINNDIYYDYDTGKKAKNNNKNAQKNQFLKPSSNCQTELYSMPTQDNSYKSSRGTKGNDGGGVGGKTGVTIIWD